MEKNCFVLHRGAHRCAKQMGLMWQAPTAPTEHRGAEVSWTAMLLEAT